MHKSDLSGGAGPSHSIYTLLLSTTMSTEFDVEGTLSLLSLPNKIKLLTGQGSWHTEAVAEAGVPSMRLSDGNVPSTQCNYKDPVSPVKTTGPNGVRGTRFFNGVPSSCFPASTGLGSSFDVDLVRKVGEALGDESRAKGCHVLLAPTVNTQRSPLGGRGFESFSEDPHLNGTIASAYINGLQSKGVSATIKHFVANDQEFQRFSISSDVSERALREIYLKPFQIAIKNSNPWALMTAYNRVNGLHASEDKRLLDDILRTVSISGPTNSFFETFSCLVPGSSNFKEWGFKGLVMSDWNGVYSTVESIKAGLDLEMPGPSLFRGKALERSIVAEKLFHADIDVRVRKVLELLKHAHASGIPFDGPEESVDTLESRQTLRTAAADSIVLLKNDKKLLPLTGKAKKIVVIGPNAKHAMTSGGGSAQLLSTYSISPLQGIKTAAKEIGAEVTYTIGAVSHRYLPLLDPYVQQPSGRPGVLIEFWNDPPVADYVSTSPDFKAPLEQAIWSTPTLTTHSFMTDGIDETKVNLTCWMRITAKFTPDEDGDWEFGLSIAGRANLFLNQKLVIDLSTNPPQGESFFGLGTSDEQTVVKGLKAGQVYDLELRLSNAEFAVRGSPFRCWGGVRMGAMKQINGDGAITEAVQLAKAADGKWESEGFDRTDIGLPGLTNQLVREVLLANPNTVVVNQSGTPVSMPWIEEASAVVQAFYGGNELGNGLADVLFGKVNPSGKLPLTFPKCLEDSPSYLSFGNKGQEHGKILYNEGIFVGYRGFEIKNVAPLFPFGFGLSYTQFEYSHLNSSTISPDGKFKVTFDIMNIGDVQGREVAQIYVTDQRSSLPRPTKELKGFVKVDLKPGETKRVEYMLDREALGFYDDRAAHWIAEEGIFTVMVAASSTDIRLTTAVELEEEFTWTGL
ncbi:hypothetical protein D9615_000633 [Tricholomella constricta]|uniref:beta-glucosidase n=1 Tax=Tricholomella constricta TaxID=117010 RepID=A0A8H5HRW8_9AGAR|nr:hypothetical protein D9615_000633 [Tricholomella constricta]